MATTKELCENINKIDQLVYFIRVSEQAERYEDMCTFVKKLVKLKTAKSEDLTVEERNLMSVAFKNVVGSKRSSWRTLNAEYMDSADETLLNPYKQLVINELEVVCKEVIDLTSCLCKLASDKANEAEVFYFKMCADYYRYLAEIIPDSEEYKSKAKEYYQKAMDVAEKTLAETHPTRLGLALNFSVCYYEILKQPDMACDLAKKSFDSAIEKLDSLQDSSYKDSTLIMQLLRDNLTLWTSDAADEEDADDMNN